MLAVMKNCFDVVKRRGLPLNGLASIALYYKQLFWPFCGLSFYFSGFKLATGSFVLSVLHANEAD